MNAVLSTEDSHGAWLEPLFDVAFDAPGGIARLRQLILGLAMQGKLVPQISSEAPASKLLKQSRSVMSKAMDEGRAKKEKPAATVLESEKTFATPSGWEWCRLVDMGQFINGAAFKPSDWGKTGRPIIRIQNLSGRNTEFNRTQKEFDSSILVQDGDLLVSWSATLDAFVWRGEEGVLNQHIFRVLPAPLADRDFLYWLLKLVIRQLADSDHAHGLVMAHINRGPFLAHPIAIPPLNEQKRIVARIDQLMSRCDELERLRQKQSEKCAATRAAAMRQWLAGDEAAAALLGEQFATLVSTREDVADLRKAILRLAMMGKLVAQDPTDAPAAELLKQIEAEKARLVKAGKIRAPKALSPIADSEKPYTLPGSWEWVRLGEVGAFERGRSKHRPRNDKKLFEGGTIPFVQTGDVSRSKLTGYKIGTCSGYYSQFGLQQSRLWDKGTLCITIAANIAETGFLGMDACIPDSVVAFLSADEAISRIVKVFIDVAKDDLEHYAPSTAQKNINLEIINELIFPLAPLGEQRRIVARIDQLMQLCDTLEQNIDAAQAKQTELLEAVMARV